MAPHLYFARFVFCIRQFHGRAHEPSSTDSTSLSPQDKKKMPPYRAGGAAGGRGAGAAGTLSHKVNDQDTQLQDWLAEIATGTKDTATFLGLAEQRYNVQ